MSERARAAPIAAHPEAGRALLVVRDLVKNFYDGDREIRVLRGV